MLPISQQDFQNFIEKNKLFERTYQLMCKSLKHWYEDDSQHFIEDMWADLDTVMKTYHFENEGVSISKNYSYEPPLDYISCYIRVYDAEWTYCMEYTAYFDEDLKEFDDKIAP